MSSRVPQIGVTRLSEPAFRFGIFVYTYIRDLIEIICRLCTEADKMHVAIYRINIDHRNLSETDTLFFASSHIQT